MRARKPAFSPLWVLIFLVLGLIMPFSFNACGEFQSNRFTEIPDHFIEDQGDELSIDNPNEALPILSGMFLKIEST